MPRIGTKAIAGLAASGIIVAAGGALGGWALGGSDRSKLRGLRRDVAALASSVARAEGERDRLKAERDRLETQMAAATKSPVACPDAILSTSDAGLLARFTVEYPCGWNVLEQPLNALPADSPDGGLTVDHLLFSALPISLAPREGPLAEITLETWYDDANEDADALPARDAWITKAKARFEQVTQTQIATRAGIPVVKLAGTMRPFGDAIPAVLYVWEFTDANAVRKICEAFALDPGRTVKQTIESLVRSFRPLER